MGPNQTEKFLHSKGNPKENKKTTYRMGENSCKWSNWQGINLQNIQIPPVAQYQKKKKTQCSQQMGRRSKKAFLQRRHTNSPEEFLCH